MRSLLPSVLLLIFAAPSSAANFDARADSLLIEGRRLHEEARLAEAESLLVVGIDLAEQSNDSLTLARLLARRVLVRCGRGLARDPATEADAKQSVLLYERTLGPNHAEYAYGLGVHGRMLRMSARLDEAQPKLERGAAILDSIRHATGQVYDPGPFQDLAMLNGTRGEWARCIAYYHRVIADLTQLYGADHHSTLIQTMNLGQVYTEVGHYDSARVALETALQGMRRRPEARPDARASALVNLGALLYTIGDFAESRALHLEAVALQEQVLGRDHPNLSVTLGNLSTLHMELGDLGEARATAERAAEIAELRYSANDHRLGMALETLAAVLLENAEYRRTADLAQRARRAHEAAQGPDHEDLIPSLMLLAQSLDRLDQPDSAEVWYRKAVELAERRLNPNDVRLATTLGEYGAFLRRRHATERAGEFLDRAVAAFEGGKQTMHPRYAESLAERGLLRLQRGEAEPALADALRAEDLSRDHFRRTIASLPEKVALRFSTARPRGLGIAVAAATMLQGRSAVAPARALDALIRSRALVLDEMARRHRGAPVDLDPATREIEDRLAAARSRMANLLVAWTRDGSESLHEAYRSAERKVCELEDEALTRGRAGTPCDDSRGPAETHAGLAEVRGALAPGEAMISLARYAIGDSVSYAAFVTRRDREHVEVVRIGAEKPINALCRAWLDQIATDPRRSLRSAGPAERGCRELGNQVRKWVWDPLLPHLDGVGRVLIVPDGMLSFIPFAALPQGADGYLVEAGPTLHYLSAERDLIRGETADAGQGLLAFGGPDYDAAPAQPGDEELLTDARATAVNAASTPPAIAPYRGPESDCAAVRSLRFEPLPGARHEVLEVAEMWDGAVPQAMVSSGAMVRVGAHATEGSFKREARGRSVLHLATHAFVIGERCQNPTDGTRAVGWLVESAPPTKKASASAAAPAAAQSPPENPLRLVGLALAGVNRRTQLGADRANLEDGVLTAEEVASLDLSGCQWAVLSSCHSGIGEYYPDEGLLGLRRAFAVAGARTLIASLWAVGDQSTQAWMTELYRSRFVHGERTDSAIRSAGLAVLEARRAAAQSTHPFYWAGFVAVGDPGGR